MPIIGPQPVWVWLLIAGGTGAGAYYTRPSVFTWRPVLLAAVVVSVLYAGSAIWDSREAIAAWVASMGAAAVGDKIESVFLRIFAVVGMIAVLVPLYLWAAFERGTRKHALRDRFSVAEIATLITGIEPTVPLPKPLEQEYQTLCRDMRLGRLAVLEPEETDMQEVAVSREGLRDYLRAREKEMPRYLEERYDAVRD